MYPGTRADLSFSDDPMVKPQRRRKVRNKKLPLFSSRKSPPPLHGGHFCFRPLTLLEFSVSIILQSCLEFPLLSQLVGYPLERIFRQKMKAVALYFYKMQKTEYNV